MAHAQWLSSPARYVVVALVLVAFSPSAFAGPIRDAVEKRLPLAAATAGKTRMHSPALFWGGVAAAGVGTLFVVGGVSSQICLPTMPGAGHCRRETEWAPVAWGIPIAAAGVVMMVVGGRHDRVASVDVAPTQVRVRIRF